MYCKKCGAEIEDDNDFCIMCGTKVERGKNEKVLEKNRINPVNIPMEKQMNIQEDTTAIMGGKETAATLNTEEKPLMASEKNLNNPAYNGGKNKSKKINKKLFIIIGAAAAALIAFAIIMFIIFTDSPEDAAYKKIENFAQCTQAGKYGEAFKCLEFYNQVEESEDIMNIITMGKFDTVESILVYIADRAFKFDERFYIEIINKKSVEVIDNEHVNILLEVKGRGNDNLISDNFEGEIMFETVKYNGEWYIASMTNLTTGKKMFFNISADSIMHYFDLNAEDVKKGIKDIGRGILNDLAS